MNEGDIIIKLVNLHDGLANRNSDEHNDFLERISKLETRIDNIEKKQEKSSTRLWDLIKIFFSQIFIPMTVTVCSLGAYFKFH